MKKIIINIGLLGCIFSMAGCEKYLTTIPDDRTVVTTTDQVTQLLTTAYPHRSYMNFAEAMSDNAEDKGNSAAVVGDQIGYSINLQAYNYQDNSINIGDDSPIGYFYDCYRAIAAANLALSYCNNADSAKYRGQKGEALLCRAYAHFMLVTLFAKPYDATTASSDPGVPYLTTVETKVFATYDRKTVQYDYDMIEKDIVAGIPLIDEKIYGGAPKFHFNLQAAHAFASRFYLFKKDYPQVVAHSSAVFGATAPATLLRNQVYYKTLSYYNQAQAYTVSSENANLLLQETNSTYGPNFYGYRFGMGETIRARMFDNANVTGTSYAITVYGATASFYNVPKFYTNVFPLFATEEVLLNRVEANIALKNYPDAITDMNSWISRNTATAPKVTTTSIMNFYKMSQDSSMVQATLDFKRVSYIEEGLRWLDVLRLKMPVVRRSGPTIAADDKRRVLQLPAEAATAGMPLNPR
ncbi:MAG: RagB/SusD family nutrient uptake outer membrane protein [Filimonas sp.]|nr:RagB/SusD family nutrient uptake outer membrane protein [Filimonas sp.]